MLFRSAKLGNKFCRMFGHRKGFAHIVKQGVKQANAMFFGEIPVETAAGAILAHSGTVDGKKFRKGRHLNADDVARLLENPDIIRNCLKVNSIIHNAGVIQELRASHDGFAKWRAAHHPQDLAAWVELFKKTFKLTGPEVVNEFLMSTGYLEGAHQESCPVYQKIAKTNPPWLAAKRTR